MLSPLTSHEAHIETLTNRVLFNDEVYYPTYHDWSKYVTKRSIEAKSIYFTYYVVRWQCINYMTYNRYISGAHVMYV